MKEPLPPYDYEKSFADILSELLKLGYRKYPGGLLRERNLENWIATKTMVGLPQCDNNEKPPQVVISPWRILRAEREYSFASFDVEIRGAVGLDCDGTHQDWFQLRVYGVHPYELLEKLPTFEKQLSAAWVAVKATT